MLKVHTRLPASLRSTCLLTRLVLLAGPQEPQTIRALVEQERADVLCLQETKLKQADEAVAEAQLQALLPSWRIYWNSSTARKGYSGVCLLSR